MPQLVPNGPRTPTVAPIGAMHSAWVTAPTSRMECSIGPGAPGALEIEMATSPTPNAVIMLNWPWANADDVRPLGDSRARVTTSPTSTRRPTMR